MSVLVGREAPDFTAAAVLGNGEIVEDFNLKNATSGKYTVVFFYPLDFTFVCPSELIAFDHRLEEFKKEIKGTWDDVEKKLRISKRSLQRWTRDRKMNYSSMRLLSILLHFEGKSADTSLIHQLDNPKNKNA